MYFTRMDLLIASLQARDLPNEDLQVLAEVIGLEAVKKILRQCPGMNFYVPLKLSADFNRRYILENYGKDGDGVSEVRKIAKALNVTQKTVWQILGTKRPASRAA